MMSYEYLELGPAPAEEDCLQVGHVPFQRIYVECSRYVSLLKALLPVPDHVDAFYVVKKFPHELGSYCEACIMYNANKEDATEFAFYVEANAPMRWNAS